MRAIDHLVLKNKKGKGQGTEDLGEIGGIDCAHSLAQGTSSGSWDYPMGRMGLVMDVILVLIASQQFHSKEPSSLLAVLKEKRWRDRQGVPCSSVPLLGSPSLSSSQVGGPVFSSLGPQVGTSGAPALFLLASLLLKPTYQKQGRDYCLKCLILLGETKIRNTGN